MNEVYNVLVREHLESCKYKIAGYWDESDRYYEEIALPRRLSAELINRAIAVCGDKHRIYLQFVLKSATPKGVTTNGTLMLIYEENLEFVDENWQIDLNSL